MTDYKDSSVMMNSQPTIMYYTYACHQMMLPLMMLTMMINDTNNKS